MTDLENEGTTPEVETVVDATEEAVVEVSDTASSEIPAVSVEDAPVADGAEQPSTEETA